MAINNIGRKGGGGHDSGKVFQCQQMVLGEYLFSVPKPSFHKDPEEKTSRHLQPQIIHQLNTCCLLSIDHMLHTRQDTRLYFKVGVVSMRNNCLQPQESFFFF